MLITCIFNIKPSLKLKPRVQQM